MPPNLGKPPPTLLGRLTWHWPQVVWQPPHFWSYMSSKPPPSKVQPQRSSMAFFSPQRLVCRLLAVASAMPPWQASQDEVQPSSAWHCTQPASPGALGSRIRPTWASAASAKVLSAGPAWQCWHFRACGMALPV